jgi:hypothetical protein
VIVALPLHGNITAALRAAKAGELRTVHADAIPVHQLQSIDLVGAVIVEGSTYAIDVLRARHRILFVNAGE